MNSLLFILWKSFSFHCFKPAYYNANMNCTSYNPNGTIFPRSICLLSFIERNGSSYHFLRGCTELWPFGKQRLFPEVYHAAQQENVFLCFTSMSSAAFWPYGMPRAHITKAKQAVFWLGHGFNSRSGPIFWRATIQCSLLENGNCFQDHTMWLNNIKACPPFLNPISWAQIYKRQARRMFWDPVE